MFITWIFFIFETIFYRAIIQRENHNLTSFTLFTTSEASFEWCKRVKNYHFQVDLWPNTKIVEWTKNPRCAALLLDLLLCATFWSLWNPPGVRAKRVLQAKRGLNEATKLYCIDKPLFTVFSQLSLGGRMAMSLDWRPGGRGSTRGAGKNLFSFFFSKFLSFFLNFLHFFLKKKYCFREF